MIKQDAQVLLDTLFREGEEVCVSHDEFGYHSLPLEHLSYETIELIPPSTNQDPKIIPTSDIKLIALNPTKGFRRDENVTAFRNFLIEMDDLPLPEQLRYAEELGLPYSLCVFSGGKSLHFAVCLEDGLPSYEIYYFIANWILNIMAKADQKTKNPTRSIRFPGAIRNGKEQKLVKHAPRITYGQLSAWLSKYEGLKPSGFFNGGKAEKGTGVPAQNKEKLIPGWVWSKLSNGVENLSGRNNEWFKIASEFGKLGYEEEETIEILDSYFVSQYDFKRREWITAVKSGTKNGRNKGNF